jgi:hypothetical protein
VRAQRSREAFRGIDAHPAKNSIGTGPEHFTFRPLRRTEPASDEAVGEILEPQISQLIVIHEAWLEVEYAAATPKPQPAVLVQ